MLVPDDIWFSTVLHKVFNVLSHPSPAQEFDEIPPFRPELASDAAVRQRVRSSGYGRKTASPPKRVEIQDGVRPWEEKPTFKPNLTFNEESEKLRKNARSSGYGKSVVNNKPKPEPER